MRELAKRRGAAEEEEGTIRHGVAASTTMAMDITPNHPVVRDYLEYVPKSTDPEVLRLWAKLVHEPVYNAVNRHQPVLRKHKMLDQVFRFQDLDALVDRLEAKTPEDKPEPKSDKRDDEAKHHSHQKPVRPRGKPKTRSWVCASVM